MSSKHCNGCLLSEKKSLLADFFHLLKFLICLFLILFVVYLVSIHSSIVLLVHQWKHPVESYIIYNTSILNIYGRYQTKSVFFSSEERNPIFKLLKTSEIKAWMNLSKDWRLLKNTTVHNNIGSRSFLEISPSISGFGILNTVCPQS